MIKYITTVFALCFSLMIKAQTLCYEDSICYDYTEDGVQIEVKNCYNLSYTICIPWLEDKKIKPPTNLENEDSIKFFNKYFRIDIIREDSAYSIQFTDKRNSKFVYSKKLTAVEGGKHYTLVLEKKADIQRMMKYETSLQKKRLKQIIKKIEFRFTPSQ